MARCQSQRKDGERCRNNAIPCKKYCYIKSHGASEEVFHKRFWNFLTNKVFTAGVLALVSLIVTIVWNFYQDRSLQELNYQQNSVAYRPLLEFLGKPSITGIGFSSDSVRVVEDTIDFVAKVRFNASIKLVNKEKYLAKIIAEAATDTLTGNDYLRQLLLSQDARMNLFPSQDLFPFKELGYLDTISISINHQIRQVSETQQGILHFFVIYENEVGVLYDVYYWARFTFNPVPMVPGQIEIEESTGLLSQNLKIAKLDMMKAIKFNEDNVSQYVYSKKERDRIIEFFRERSVEPSKITYPVQISTKGPLVINPTTDEEVWKIRTVFSYSGHPSIKNVTAFVWFDTLATFTEIPKEVFDSKVLNFDLVETHESIVDVFKTFINKLLTNGCHVYKHSVVIFENLKQQKYQSVLTERMEIENKKVRWILVKSEIGNRI